MEDKKWKKLPLTQNLMISNHLMLWIQFKINYFQEKLTRVTVHLAKGNDAVCVFVNDTIDSFVIDELIKMGIKLIALRSAGFNHVDLQTASNKIPIVRVPAYSPHAVAEHAMALLLTLNRKIQSIR